MSPSPPCVDPRNGERHQREVVAGSCWWEFLQALDAIKARSELFVMVIMLFQFILAHNCVGGRFPLVVITLVLNGTKFIWAGFFPPDLSLCFGGTNPSIPSASQ